MSETETSELSQRLVNARDIVTLRGSMSGSCDELGNGSCAQNPWEPAGTHSNQLQELKSIFSAFFCILFAFLENFQYFQYKSDTVECYSVFKECLERWYMSENIFFMLEKMHKVLFLVVFGLF